MKDYIWIGRLSQFGCCGGQNTALLQRVPCPKLELVNMLFYIVKWILQIDQGPWDGEIILDYLNGPHLISWVLKVDNLFCYGKIKRYSGRNRFKGCYFTDGERGTQTKNIGSLKKLEKAKKQVFLQSLHEQMQSCCTLILTH